MKGPSSERPKQFSSENQHFELHLETKGQPVQELFALHSRALHCCCLFLDTSQGQPHIKHTAIDGTGHDRGKGH